jgi:hypothetical protein
MTKNERDLQHDELEEVEGEPLPERAAMSAIMPPPPFADPRLMDTGVDLVPGPSPVPIAHIPETGE